MNKNWLNKLGVTLFVVAIFVTPIAVVSLLTNGGNKQSPPERYSQGHVTESNYYVPPAKATIKDFAKKFSDRREVSDGSVVVTVNCDENYFITTLKPGESREITHTFFGENQPTRNRCSYDPAGNAVPVGGIPGMATLPERRNNLPFPDVMGQAMVLYLAPHNAIRPWEHAIAYDYIRHSGGKVMLTNRSTEEMDLWVIYNFPLVYLEDINIRQGIGHDGSTVTLNVSPPLRAS